MYKSTKNSLGPTESVFEKVSKSSIMAERSSWSCSKGNGSKIKLKLIRFIKFIYTF